LLEYLFAIHICIVPCVCSHTECYATGSGVPRDFALAVEYLRGAVRLRHRGAALRLAAFLERGNDSEHNDSHDDATDDTGTSNSFNDNDRDRDCNDSVGTSAAVAAAAAGGAFGDGQWGGLALARDLPAAHALHALGAEWGCAHAMFALAFEYQHGVGTEANAELAAQWYGAMISLFSLHSLANTHIESSSWNAKHAQFLMSLFKCWLYEIYFRLSCFLLCA
jgi:TPR repeat protein